jgi:nucleotide-binding universal stress UspA family protein
MYKKMLVPLDGSEFSECVLDHVTAIAKGCQVPEVVLLGVAEPISHQVYYMVGIENRLREMQKETEKYVESYLSKAADSLRKDDIAVKTVVVSGRPAEEILDYANKNQVDLIIMSTHGRAGVSRWVLGSVTDRVVRHSRAPVLTITPTGCR